MRNSRILGQLVSISSIVAIGLFSAVNAHAEADSFGFGSGRTGDVTISGSGMVVNSYASVTADVATGATTIQVDAATGFAAGDLIMIWKSTGLALARAPGSQTTIPMDGDSTGTFEYARIKSIASNVITLTNPIVSSSTFTAAQSQVVKIPEFHTLTIDAAASIVAAPWDGTKGGIAVVFAESGVVNNGTIAADGQGLRGGFHKQDESVFGCAALDGPAVNTILGTIGINAAAGGAKKGEGLFPNSYSTDTTTDASNPLSALYITYGYGNVSTGGGGGDCHNSGGGGGGHGGVGGTGGHTYDGTEGLFNDGNRAVGGTGGTTITYTPTVRMSMGGGGGAGEDNDNVGTAGAAGGGVVFVRASSLTGTGALSADGASAANATTVNYDGAGGGGAGGLVVVRVMTNAACGAIHANGGAGGAAQDQHGPGGGGAGGYVLVQAATDTCGTNATETGGAAGLDMLDDAGNDGNYGATGGADGATATPPPGGFSPTPCDVPGGTCGGCTGPSDCPPGDMCNGTTNQCDFPDGGIDDGGIGFDAGSDAGGANDGGLADGGTRDGGTGRDGGSGNDGGTTGDGGVNVDGGENGNGDGGSGDLFDLGSLEGGGCGCSTPGSSGTGNTAAFAIAAMAALAVVRRKRK